METFYIKDLLCSFETIKHNGIIIIKHGEMKRRYIGYSELQAKYSFARELGYNDIEVVQ